MLLHNYRYYCNYYLFIFLIYKIIFSFFTFKNMLQITLLFYFDLFKSLLLILI